MLFDKEQVLNEMKNDESLKEGDYHQAVLDACYARWNKEKEWGYEDVVNYAGEKFGEAAQFLLLMGKYNQQVCNGGHSQYFSNGYASNGGGHLMDHDYDCDLHCKMVDLFKKLEFHEHKIGGIIYKLQERFGTILYECVSEDEDESDEENGLDFLDDLYFKVNEEWMEYLNSYAKELFEK